MSNWKSSVIQPARTQKSSIKKLNFDKERITNTLGTIKDTSFKAGFTRKARENHTHIIGGTGSGKSKIIELLLREDIQNRQAGLILIDPHGTLYEDIVRFASHRYPRLAERFILFHPANEYGYTVGFNPIISDSRKIDYVIDNLILACLKGFKQEDSIRTPRITKWLANIFHLLIINDLTLLETVPLISTKKENDFRNMLIEKAYNELVLEDWDMFHKSNQTQKQNLIEGASNRLRKFLSSDIIRCIIGQKVNTLNISKAMDEGKIILVNLNNKDNIARENNQLLGTMLVNEIFRCATNRDDKNPKLKPFYVYIDEFARFVTRDIAYGLEETRKYKVFFTLAHQHLAQLKKEDEYLYSSVMTNCKNKIVFGSLSFEDADIMSQTLHAGFLDLKKVKDEIYRMRERHIEEVREVITKSEGLTDTTGWSETDSTSHSSASGKGEGGAFSDSSTDSYRGDSYYGDSKNRTHAEGKQSSKTSNKFDSQSSTEGSSQGKSGSQAKTKNESRAFVPFHRVEEVEELSSRTFWSLAELNYMKMGEMKNQPTAQAIIKIGSDKPFQCEIKRVQEEYYHLT